MKKNDMALGIHIPGRKTLGSRPQNSGCPAAPVGVVGMHATCEVRSGQSGRARSKKVLQCNAGFWPWFFFFFFFFFSSFFSFSSLSLPYERLSAARVLTYVGTARAIECYSPSGSYNSAAAFLHSLLTACAAVPVRNCESARKKKKKGRRRKRKKKTKRDLRLNLLDPAVRTQPHFGRGNFRVDGAWHDFLFFFTSFLFLLLLVGVLLGLSEWLRWVRTGLNQTETVLHWYMIQKLCATAIGSRYPW